jgi:hypothetical protein
MKSTAPLSVLALVALVAAVPACARAQDGQLYRHDLAAVARFHIVDANAEGSPASAELFDGTQCVGHVSRGRAPSAPTDAHALPPRPDVETGRAILRCTASAFLECALTYRLMGGVAYGDCVDQRGAKYTLVF